MLDPTSAAKLIAAVNGLERAADVGELARMPAGA
jgi:hypothetical protein